MAGKADLKITVNRQFLKSDIASAIEAAGEFKIDVKVKVDTSELTKLESKIKGLEKSKIHVGLVTNGDGKTSVVGATEKYATKELEVQKKALQTQIDLRKASADAADKASKAVVARINAESKAESEKNKMIADGLKSRQKLREQDNANRRKIELENAKQQNKIAADELKSQQKLREQDNATKNKQLQEEQKRETARLNEIEKQKTAQVKASETRATAEYKAQIREQQIRQKEIADQEKAAAKAQEKLTKLYNEADKSSMNAKDLAGGNYLNEAVVKGSPAAINALNQLKEASNALDAVKEKIKNADGTKLDALQQELKDATAQFNAAKKSAAEFSDSFVNSPKYMQNVAKLEKASSEMRQYMSKNTAIKKDASLYAEGQSIINSAKNLSASSADIATLNSQWSAYKAKVQEAGLAHSSFASGLKDALGSVTKYFSATMVVYKGIAKVKEAVKSLQEYDTIITEISKATGEKKSSFDDLLNTAYDTASGYGTSVEGYLTGVQEMARAGFRGDQMTGLANLSALAQSAGAMSDELANQLLIAANAAWQMNGNVEELNTALDGMVNVSNNNAVNMTSLSTAFTKVASQGASAGISVGELTAMLGTIKASTQLADTTVGQSMKGILMNLQQVKGEVGEGEEITDADLTKYEKSAAALGVSLKEMKDGTLVTRDTVTVLKELSDAYNALPDRDVRKANLLSSIGGKLRANALDALLKNWDTYEKQLKEFNSADNVAEEMAAKTANSWEGRLQALSNNWNKFVGTFVDSDLMTFLTGTATGIIGITSSITDLIGAIPMLTGAISAFMSAKNNTGFFKTYTDASGATRIGTFWKANDAMRQNVMNNNISSIESLFTGLTDDNTAGFDNAMNMARQRANDLGGAYATAFNQTLAGQKTASGVKGAFAQFNDKVAAEVGSSTQSIGARIKSGFKNIASTALSSLANMGIMMLVSKGVELGVGLITEMIQHNEKILKAAVEDAGTTATDVDNIENYKTQVDSLREKLDSGNLSEKEAYDVRVQLSSIQDEIIDKYGKEAAGLDVLHDSLSDVNGEFDKLTNSQLSQYLSENSEAIRNAYNDVYENKGFAISSTFSGTKEARAELKKIAERYGGTYEYNPNLQNKSSLVFPNANRQEIADISNKVTQDVRHYIAHLQESESNPTLAKAFDTLLDDFGAVVQEAHNDVYESEMTVLDQAKESILATDSHYKEINDAIAEADKKLDESAGGDLESRKAAVNLAEEVNAKQVEYNLDTTEGKIAQHAIDELRKSLMEKAGKEKLKLDFDMDDASFQKTKEKIKTLLGDGDFSSIISADEVDLASLTKEQLGRYEQLEQIAEDYNITLQDLASISGEYGIGIDKSSSAMLALENNLSNATSAVTNYTTAQESMTKALQEQEELGTITSETLADLEANFGDLTGVLEDTGLGLSVNADKLRELSQAQAEAANDDLRGKLAETEELFNNNASIISYYQENMSSLTKAQREDYQARLEYNSSLADTIEKYALLSAQLEYASSGYKAWMDAQSAPDTGDVQESARSAYEYLDKVYNYNKDSADEYGRVGSVKAKAAQQFLIPQDVLDKGEESVRNYIANINKYMSGGIDSAQSYLDDLVNNGLAKINDKGNYEMKPKVNISDVEKKLHITHDLATAMFGELEEYGIDVKFSDEFNTQVDSLVSKFQEVKDKVLEIQELESSLSRLGHEPDKMASTKQQIEDARNELSGLVDDLWKAAQQSDIDIEAKFGVKTKDELTDKIINGEITVEDINADVVTPDADNIDTLKAKVEELKEPVNISFEWDLDSFNNILSQIKTKLEAVKNGDIDELSVPITADETNARRVLEFVQNFKFTDKIANIFGKNHTKPVVDEANAELDRVHDRYPTIHTQLDDSGGVRGFFNNIWSQFGGTKTVTLNTQKNETTHKTTIFDTIVNAAKGKPSVNGTAHINGTAYRNGNWGVPHNQTALTGELGQELVVRGSNWFTVGDHGAEFVPLRKGDIVFNHKQTEDLFKHGYVAGRGQAFLEGTAYANSRVSMNGRLMNGGNTSNAGNTTVNAKNVTVNTNGNGKTNTPSKTNTNNNKNNSKPNTKKTKTAVESALDALNKLFDWVEIKLTKTADKTEKKINQIDKVTNRNLAQYQKAKNGSFIKVGNKYYDARYDYDKKKKKYVIADDNTGAYYLAGTKKDKKTKKTVPIYKRVPKKAQRYVYGQFGAINSAIAQTNSEIRINKAAKVEYMDTANAVKRKINKASRKDSGKDLLTDKIIKNIKDGKIDVSKYGEKQRQAIEEYKKWYDKAQDTVKTVQELEQKQHELQMKKLEVIDQYYNNRINRWTSHASIGENTVERIDTAVTGEGNLFSEKQKDKIRDAFESQRHDLGLQAEHWGTNASKLQAQLDKLVSSKKVKKYSDEWYEWVQKINDAKANVQSVKTSIEELDNSEADLMQNNISGYYESLFSVSDAQLSKLQAGIEKITAKMTEEGQLFSNGQMTDIIDNYQKQREKLLYEQEMYTEEAVTLQAELDRQLKNKTITEGDSSWSAYMAAIKEAEASAKTSAGTIAQIDDNLTSTLLENLTNYFDLRTSYMNSVAETAEARLESLIAQGKETAGDERSSISGRISAQQEALKNYQQELTKTEQLLTRLMDAGEIEKNDAQWYELTETIENLRQEIYQTTGNVADLKRQLYEVNLDRLEQALKRMQSIRDVSESLISLNEAQAEQIRDAQYVEQISHIDNELENLQKQYAELTAEQKLYEVGSDLWYDLEQSILDNREAVLNLKKTQENYYDKIIDLQVEALKKKKEEFQELNDAADKQLKLEKALEALERARTQRTKLIYRENRGFVYEADQDAIRDAQEDLDDIYYDAILDDFDKAIDGLQELQDNLNLYDRDANRKTETKDIIATVNAAGDKITKTLDGNLDSYNNGTYIPHYAGGIKSVPRSGYANVDEMRPELIARGRYTWLEKGDTVFPNSITDNLWSFGRNPQAFLSQMLENNLSDVNLSSNKTENVNVNINGGLTFPNITSGDQAEVFVKELNRIALKATQRIQKS